MLGKAWGEGVGLIGVVRFLRSPIDRLLVSSVISTKISRSLPASGGSDGKGSSSDLVLVLVLVLLVFVLLVLILERGGVEVKERDLSLVGLELETLSHPVIELMLDGL